MRRRTKVHVDKSYKLPAYQNSRIQKHETYQNSRKFLISVPNFTFKRAVKWPKSGKSVPNFTYYFLYPIAGIEKVLIGIGGSE